MRKIFTHMLCLLLAVVMFSAGALTAFAQGEEQKLYIKDVKLIYAESADVAKAGVPEGYRFVEKDLNAGTDADYQVYLAYSTTKNPDEAITDTNVCG